MKPLVSAIIPNFNYSQYVCEAVESALSQTYANCEVIVVDDGSTDDSVRMLRGFGERITLVEQNNSGVSVSRNEGVKRSEGDLIAFLDADDVWLPEKVEKQVERFLAEPDIGLIHVGVRDIDTEGRLMDAHQDGMAGEVSNDLLLLEGPVILGGGSGIMVSRKVFDLVGGFDPQLSTSADWDLFYQVTYQFRTSFLPEILLHYRLHGTNMHGNIHRMQNEMLSAFEKAFATEDPTVLKIKRRALGNLHRVLAGSYFCSGEYRQFAMHAAKSIWSRPSAAAYFLEFPLRRLRKVR